MVFTIGDLIVLGLVVVVLLIFRQLDRNNRSLEKVKRLGDKLMSDLDAVTQEKVAQLKDMAIEVDVHQQASKMAMERLHIAETGLNDRSAQMEEMQVRIDAYDAALRELISMTQKAEENISRMRDESAYIDKVGRRIRQAAGQLQDLQNRIPQMLGEFSASNQDILKQTQEQIVQSFASRLDMIQERIDTSDRIASENIQLMQRDLDEVQEDLGRRADGYRRAFDEIEKDYRSRLEDVARKGLELETESLRRLTENIDSQIDERHRDLRAVIENAYLKIQAQAGEMDTQVSQLRERMGGWELEMRQRTLDVQGTFESRVSEQDRILEDGLVKLSTFIREAQDEILHDMKLAQERASQRVVDFQDTIRRYITESQGKLEQDIEVSRAEVGALISESREAAGQDLIEYERSIDTYKSRLENELSSLTDHVERVRDDMARQIAASHEDDIRSLDDFQARMQEQVERLEGGIYQVEQGLEEKLVAAQERGRTLAETLLTRINQDVDNKTDSMRDAINQRVEQVNASVQASHDQIDESFNELRGRVDSWIDASKAYMSRLEEQVRALNESSRQANTEHKATVEQHIAETRERLDSYEQGLSARVAELESIITRAEDMVRDQFDALTRRAGDLAAATGRGLDEQYETGKAQLLEEARRRIDGLRGELEEGRFEVQEQIAGLKSEIHDEISLIRSSIDGFEGESAERQVEASRLFETRIRDLEESLQAHGSSVKDRIQEMLGGWSGEIRRLLDEGNTELTRTRDFHNRLETEQNLIDKRVEELRKTGADQAESVRTLIKAALESVQSDVMVEIENYAAAAGKRVDTVSRELKDQARLAEQDLDSWKDTLTAQIEELRALAQGLHQDTLGSVRESISGVQKQAQDLYARIQSEVGQSLTQYETQIMGLMGSTESDIRRVQALTSETQTRILSWQEQLGKTEAEIAKDVQEVRENARVMALKGIDDMRMQLSRRQDEAAQALAESIAKLKSDIQHSRSDVEQDVVFLNQQIDQWKATFQDHLKTLQENSRQIEEQAIAGLKERIEELREEARQLTRNAQDEFAASISSHQGQIQTQLEAYQSDLRRVQTLNKDVQSQIQAVEDDIARAQSKAREEIGDVQAEASRLSAALREAVQKEIEERHRVLLVQVKQVLDQIGGDVNASKTNLERELGLIQQQVEASRSDMLERIKSVQNDSANLRRETMAGFQERLDALRDEARKMTGNVKAEIGALLGEHQSQVEKQLKQTEDEVHRVQDLHATSQLRFNEITEIFSKAEAMAVREFEVLRDKTRQLAEGSRAQIQQEITKQREEVLLLARQNIESIQQEIGQSRRSMQTEATGLVTEFEHYSADLRERFEALGKQGNVMQEQTLKAFQTDLDKMRQQTDGIAQNMQEQANRTIEQQRQTIAGLLVQSTEEIARTKGNYTEVQAIVTQMQQDIAKRVAGLEQDIETFAKGMGDRIRDTTEAYQQQVLTDVEKRLKDYEKEIGYRIEKIETVNDDIDNLESNLRQSMDRLTQRLKGDLEKLGQDMHRKREEDIVLARKDIEGINLQMIGIEREIEDLKKRAYDNVNQTLKVFEDEFFVDLKARSERMDLRFDEWRGQVNSNLEQMESAAQSERAALEERYSAALKERLNDLSSRLAGQYEKIESGFNDFQSSLQERLGAAERNVQQVESGIKDEIQNLQNNAIDSLQREFVRMNQDVESRIRTYEREVEARLQKSDQEFRGKASDLQTMFETIRSDTTIWQNQVLQQIKNSEGALQQDVASLRSRTNQTINEIKEDFVRQKDDLVTETSEERIALKQEIQIMAERVSRLQSDLEYKTREAIDLFNRDYQSFQADFQRHNRETQEELEDRMKDFRGFVVDTREEFEGMQRRLFGKVDEDAKALDINLREIDKRIKGFLTQTKLFERADSMKDALTEQIDLMKHELNSLEEQRKGILDLDPYLAKVRKLAEEVNERMNRLMTEKRRLDGLDEDYKKLMSISQVVDQKLAQVTASNDTLTEIQLSIRHLEEVHKDVEAKFDRLERKGDILDATADGIEKNFQYLQDMERRVGEVRGVVADLPKQVQDLSERVSALSGHKKEADQALKSMVNLDKVLKNIEERIGELNKARDWIARTETRLEEISREADEKVSILSTLVKNEISAEARSGNVNGGPSNSVRDVVIKLAQQGWRVEEIARTTKLSRGEVELILEMGGRS